MPVKLVLRFFSHSARPLCQDPVVCFEGSDPIAGAMSSTQRGASTLVLALFVVVILVTAMVGLILGHNLGYQRGYYAMDKETQQALVDNKETTEAFEDLRLSNKVALNQAATAKQELAISLANVDKLRADKKALIAENKKRSQLNKLYADIISANGGMPLQVLGANINPLPENAFEYKFDIGMLARDGRPKSLKASLTLLNNNDFVKVPLDLPDHKIAGITRIRGRFIMPSGFKPLQVKLTLQADGQEVAQLYDWKNGARVNNLPLSLLDLPAVDDSPIEPDS